MAYLQDLSGNRMGTYQVIASSIGARENLRGMDECVQALRGVLHRTMAALRQKGRSTPPCRMITVIWLCFPLRRVADRAVLCFQAPGRANAHTKPACVDPPRTEPINKQK